MLVSNAFRRFLPFIIFCSLLLAPLFSGAVQRLCPIGKPQTLPYGRVEQDRATDQATIEKGLIQHNRVIAFLNKFDALRPIVPVALIQPALYLQRESPAHEYHEPIAQEHFYRFIAQKKPEDSYDPIV